MKFDCNAHGPIGAEGRKINRHRDGRSHVGSAESLYQIQLGIRT